MEYHYQWPEYMDPTLSEGRGWESVCLSSPPVYPDTPAMQACLPRVFPLGRPMRRRRLFPPPYNRFPRDARPQWMTPYYDHRLQWSPDSPGTNVRSPKLFDNCVDCECQFDKTSIVKPLNSPTKKIRRNKGSSQQLKNNQVARNSDQTSFGSNRTERIENAYHSECNSPSKVASIASLSLFPAIESSLIYRDQEFSQSTLISRCDEEARKADTSHNGSKTSFNATIERSERSCVERGKEDTLASIINTTIMETSEDASNNYHNVADAYRNQLDEESSKLHQESFLINMAPDSFKNGTTGNTKLCSSSQNSSGSCFGEFFYNCSIAKFPSEFMEETELAVFNLQQLNQQPDSDAQGPNNHGDELVHSEKLNRCGEIKSNNSLVLYDPSKLKPPVHENIMVKSNNIVNSTKMNIPSNTQLPKKDVSHLCNSETNDSISSLVQQNRLLTDLLSHLITGNVELSKDAAAKNLLLAEPEKSTSKELLTDSKISIPDTSLKTISETDLVFELSDFLDTDANLFSELSTQPIHEQESSTGFNMCSEQQFLNISPTKILKSSEKTTKASSESISKTSINESTLNNNSMVIQASDSTFPIETLPSNIDFPSSDSESNLLESTLSSMTNYFLEEPLGDFPDTLISALDDESSLEMLTSCVKPNSVLKVKQRTKPSSVLKVKNPRKRYANTIQSFKSKKAKKIANETKSKCKRLNNKCLKMIRRCRHKVCKDEEDCDSKKDSKESEKRLCDVEVQVDKSVTPEKVSDTCDAETQCELLENRNNIHVSLKQDCHGQWKFSNPVFEIEERLNDREDNNNVDKNETVSVMLFEIPLNVKRLPMQECGSNAEISAGSEEQLKAKDLSRSTRKERVIESSELSNSKIRSLAISYEDSFEARLPIISEAKFDQNAEEALRNIQDRTILKHQPKELIKEISHVPLKLSKIPETTRTPDVYGSSDRVLRKRKVVNYSDPVAPKRARLNSMALEMEMDNPKLLEPKDVQDMDCSTGNSKNSSSKLKKLVQNKNSLVGSGIKQTKRSLKSQRRKTD